MSSNSLSLGDLLEVTSSKRIHMADYVDAGIPFYRGKEVIERAKGNKVSTELFIHPTQFKNIKSKFGSPKLGDILLTSVGTLGVPLYISENVDFYFKDGNLTWLRNFKKGVNPKFIYYWLTSPKTQQKLDEISIGSTQRALTIITLKSLKIELPPERAQAAIVEALDAVTDRITLLHETNKTLEAIAQAIFKSWFVDFDPVRAKMEGRQPEGMDEATAALFPDSFEESELGLVPKGWLSTRLGEIATTSRKPIPVDKLNESVAYVGLEHIPRKQLSLTVWGTAQGLESTKTEFEANDILFGKLRPYFHKVVLAPLSGVCSTDVLVCKPKNPVFHAFTTLHLFSDALVAYADRLSNGAKMPRINWKDLADYQLAAPSESVATIFNLAIEPLFQRMRANVFQINTVAILRDTLLPRLISGQLRLPEAQEQIENALT